MQHSTQTQRPGISRSTTVRGRNTKLSQRSARTVTTTPGQFLKPEPTSQLSPVHTPLCTHRFNPSGLDFEIKMGYDIFLGYGKKVDFTGDEKIRACMIYKCIRHLPGFIDKKFTDVDKAVSYVTKEATRLLGKNWGLLSENGDSIREHGSLTELYEMKSDSAYRLQTVYETFDPSDGRWQDIVGLIQAPWTKDRDLVKAATMCVHIIIYHFGFHILDNGESYSVMDFNSWFENEMENAESELLHEYEQFKKNTGKKFNLKKHSKMEEAADILNLLDRQNDLIQEQDDYEERALPLFKKIQKTKPNFKFLKFIAAKYSGTDFSNWIEHILVLVKKKFHIHDYIGDAYRYIDPMIFEDAMSPLGCFGFVFNSKTYYVSDSNDMHSQNANNSCIVPFSLNTVIHPEKGIVFTTTDIPLGLWVRKLFRMNFYTLQYESK